MKPTRIHSVTSLILIHYCVDCCLFWLNKPHLTLARLPWNLLILMSPTTLPLKARPTDQKNQPHLGAWWKCQVLGPTSWDLLRQNLHFNKLPRWFASVFLFEKSALWRHFVCLRDTIEGIKQGGKRKEKPSIFISVKYSLRLKNKCRTCNERWAGRGKSATSSPYGMFRREQDFEPIQGRLAGIQLVKSPDQMEMGVAQEGTAGRKYVSFKKEISRYPGKSTGDGDLGLHTAVPTERTNLKNVQHLALTTSWGVEKLTGIRTNGCLVRPNLIPGARSVHREPDPGTSVPQSREGRSWEEIGDTL